MKKVKVDLVISTLKSQVAQSLSNPWILKIFKFLKFYRCQNCMKISKDFDFSRNSVKNCWTSLPVIFKCISDKSKVKKDQTRVFFGQVNEKNQVQLMDKGPGLPQTIILSHTAPETVTLGCLKLVTKVFGPTNRFYCVIVTLSQFLALLGFRNSWDTWWWDFY